MEHPYLYLIKLLEHLGPTVGGFAHKYPHVIYSWFVMALLIGLSAAAVKSIKLVPTPMQNVFEAIISGIEEFMVDITGEEGRWLFPVLATVFIFIATCNLIGLVPGFSASHFESQYDPCLCPCGSGLHPHHRAQISRREVYQALPRPRLVAGAPDIRHRTHRPCRPNHVPLDPSFR